MKLQGFKRIRTENFSQDDRELAGALGDTVNPFMEDISNAFNKKITVDDNLNMEYKDLDFTMGSGGLPTTTVQYKSLINGKVKGVIVINTQNLTNPNTYPTGGITATFTQSNGIVTINHVTGLVPNNQYRLTVLSMG